MSDIKQLQVVQELLSNADHFIVESNFGYAANCYLKVVNILKGLLSTNKKDEIRRILKEKVEKYQLLSKKMKNMEMERVGNSNMIEQFPKPELPKYMWSKNLSVGLLPQNKPALEIPKAIKYNKTEPVQRKLSKKRAYEGIDQDVQGLILKNLTVSFKDIIGMEDVKAVLEEAVIRPRQRPDLYEGIRAPPKAILLYGPPGNGKTYVCKALAYEANCTFIAISASSIVNKFVGQSQKMLKKVFAAANKCSPSIIFIDEIDSMLTTRSQSEHQASRRLKTQFLVLLDGISSPKAGDVLVIGATNLPKDLDPAARRRFNRMVYVGLPQQLAREFMIKNALNQVGNYLQQNDVEKIGKMLEGYSASEIKDIIKEVCMVPLRELDRRTFEEIDKRKIRNVCVKDFVKLIKERPPLLSKNQLAKYKDLN